MIFEPKISPNFLVWTCVIFILALFIFLGFKILSSPITSKRRKLILNLLLGFSLLTFLVNPKWEKKDTEDKLLIYSKKSSQIQKIKDSLNITKTVSYSTFVSNLRDYKQHSYYFLGQDLTPDILSNLEGKPVRWLPEPEIDSLENLTWNAIISKGNLQTVSGQIYASAPTFLKLKYAEKTLDSTKLTEGFNSFQLKTPVFASGKNTLYLELNNKPIQNINYFSTSQAPMSIVFLLDSPDFESRILAEWLGNQGHHVEMITKVADKTIHQTKVNKPASVDLYIIYPSGLTDPKIKKALALNQSVLVIGLENGKQNINDINKALSTNFDTKKISEADNIKIENDITALPYQFTGIQKTLDNLPVAMQKRGGKVAISLLNETFPAKLSGDTLLYSKTWLNILSALKPVDSVFVNLKAPVYKNTNQPISIRNIETLKIGDDSASLGTFGINPSNKFTDYVFSDTGWVSINDSLSVYVEPETKNAVALPLLLKNINSRGEFSKQYAQIPDFYWFIIWLVLLTALWLEPKLKSK